jgi:hypothetical protein
MGRPRGRSTRSGASWRRSWSGLTVGGPAARKQRATGPASTSIAAAYSAARAGYGRRVEAAARMIASSAVHAATSS